MLKALLVFLQVATHADSDWNESEEEREDCFEDDSFRVDRLSLEWS